MEFTNESHLACCGLLPVDGCHESVVRAAINITRMSKNEKNANCVRRFQSPLKENTTRRVVNLHSAPSPSHNVVLN